MNTLRNTLFLILLLPAITILSSHIPSSAILSNISYTSAKSDMLSLPSILEIDPDNMSDISSLSDGKSIITSQNEQITKDIRQDYKDEFEQITTRMINQIIKTRPDFLTNLVLKKITSEKEF